MGWFTIGGSLASTVLISLYRPVGAAADSDLEYTHVNVGFFMVVLMLIQGYLGYYSDENFSANRTFIPWWDKLHWYVGRGLYVFGLANVYLGLSLYEAHWGKIDAGYTNIQYVLLFIGGLALIYGELKFVQDNHVRRKSDGDKEQLLDYFDDPTILATHQQ